MFNLVVRKWALVLFALSVFFVAMHGVFETPITSMFDSLTLDTSSAALVGTLAFFALASDILLPIPSSVISIWSGVTLGAWPAFWVIWGGMTLSCVLGYWLGFGARPWLRSRWFGEQEFTQSEVFVSRFGSLAVVLLRAVPVLAEASTVLCGAMRMPRLQFFVFTTLANAGVAGLYVLFGQYLAGKESILLVFVASVALPLVGWGVYRTLAKKSTTMTAASASQSDDTSDTIQPSFSMNFSYSVIFTESVFNPSNPHLLQTVLKHAQPKDVVLYFVVDRAVAEAHPSLESDIAAYCAHHQLNTSGAALRIEGGDPAKNQQVVSVLHEKMLEAGIDRQSFVVAIGGGAMLDAVGYAAATFHRGVRLIRMPSTTLAQNDAGVGVKNGINDRGIKNLLGCFAVPAAVINDYALLASLQERDFRAGFAEAIKVALIRDGEYFHWLLENVEGLKSKSPSVCQYMIKRCAELHLRQICNGGDPFEQGSARPLDYGHWSAHKLESMTKHELNHGEAVAIGMILDALYAVELGYLAEDKAETLVQLIHSLGFAIYHPAMHWQNAEQQNVLLSGLEEFRQHLGGQLCITMLQDFGRAVEVNEIDFSAMQRALDKQASIAQALDV